MKNIRLLQLLATLAGVLHFSSRSFAQTALVQFIHNSPDQLVDAVNVRVHNQTLFDSLYFHHATALVPADTSELSSIEIYAVSDTAFLNPLISVNVPLSAGSKHIFVLNGVSDSLLYNPHAGLRLDHLDQARDISEAGNGLDMIFCHGATDVDSIDIAESALFQLTAFEGLSQGEFSDYLSIFLADFAFEIKNAQFQEIIGDYAAPFASLNWAGKAITIVSGGFVNQTENNNGLPFGLWATTRDGGPLVCLQPNTLNLHSPLQWVNNSAGGAAQDIRIRVNGIDWVSELPVHSATEFHDFPTAQAAVITIHSNLLQGPIDSIWCDTLQLPSGQSYRAFFSGQGTPESPYALNVFAFSTPNMANGDSLTLDFFNGAGCFSELTIQSDTLNQSTLFAGIAYGELSPFISVSAQQDEWIARTSLDSLTTWSLPETIDSYIGEHITLISHTSADCSEFSGWLLTETGGALMQLQTLFIPPPPVYAGIQCIHASADTSMETLSLFINDSLYIPSFNFRTASDIMRVLVNDSIRLALLPAGSSSLQNPIFTQTLYLNPNENYRLVLAGVSSSGGYNPAPNLRWVVLPAMNAPASGSCALQIIHAATDAGTIHVEENTTPIVPFFNGISFGEFSYTNSLAADQDYALGLMNSEVNFLYGVYALPINSWSWADSSITLLTSGFRQPLNNSNGSSFAVHAITAHGNVIPLSDYVSTAENSEDILLSYYPNPTSDFLNIALHARKNAVIKLELSNTIGQIVYQQSLIIGNYAQRICLETSSFPSGLYSLTIVAEEQSGPIFLSRTVVIEH